MQFTAQILVSEYCSELNGVPLNSCVPVTASGKRLSAKLRSHWIRVLPEPKDWCPYGSRENTEKHISLTVHMVGDGGEAGLRLL
jgi:hypothetical protein